MPCARAMASGSTLGSEYGTSLVTTAWVQAAEPGSGTSSTSRPSALYQPIFVAIANGVVAEETVLAHQPTRTLLWAGAGTVDASAAISASAHASGSERFMDAPLLWRRRQRPGRRRPERLARVRFR